MRSSAAVTSISFSSSSSFSGADQTDALPIPRTSAPVSTVRRLLMATLLTVSAWTRTARWDSPRDLQQNLLAANARHDVIAEVGSRALQGVDLVREVAH